MKTKVTLPAPTIGAQALNAHPVYGVSILVVRDLWLARFGDGWIPVVAEYMNDWLVVAMCERLETYRMLEEYADDNGDNYYKLKELP